MKEMVPDLAAKQAHKLMFAAEELLLNAHKAKARNCNVLVDQRRLTSSLSDTSAHQESAIRGAQDG